MTKMQGWLPGLAKHFFPQPRSPFASVKRRYEDVTQGDIDGDRIFTTTVKRTIEEFWYFGSRSEESEYMRQLTGNLRDCKVIQ